ncbi:MAG: uroporphyrinogen decarboxylase family protein, partial [Spirochaetota bacterium]
VQSWEDFESYPWPKVSDIDLSNLEWLEKNLPSNMGCYDLTAHILEIVTFLLGYENLCYKMYDEPGLVDALCERVGQFYVEYTKLLCDFSCIKVVWGSDDMGFRTSTLTSPAFLREKILPWHKRCAQVAHQKGRPYLIHTCGNLESIMHNLIEDVGIDAKHSFEDSIMPVTEAYRKYGSRVAVLGGIDVDFLCRSDQPAVRDRVRKTLDVCMQGPGGYCLGTGNTVANYIPVENYLVMLDEGRKYRVS